MWQNEHSMEKASAENNLFVNTISNKKKKKKLDWKLDSNGNSSSHASTQICWEIFRVALQVPLICVCLLLHRISRVWVWRETYHGSVIWAFDCGCCFLVKPQAEILLQLCQRLTSFQFFRIYVLLSFQSCTSITRAPAFGLSFSIPSNFL